MKVELTKKLAIPGHVFMLELKNRKALIRDISNAEADILDGNPCGKTIGFYKDIVSVTIISSNGAWLASFREGSARVTRISLRGCPHGKVLEAISDDPSRLIHVVVPVPSSNQFSSEEVA